jgi:hypothetical protein
MQIQSNPKPDFDVASEFERFLDSYRQTFLHSAPLPQKKRKAPGRRKGPTPETSDFKRRFVELSRNTSLSESAKTKKMAKENCVPGASNDVVQREQLRIKKALQRLKVIPTRNLKANRK